MKKGTNKETVQGLLDNTWDSYPPEFYITFHWKNCPRELKTVINDTKFFNNIFFMKFEGSNKPKKIQLNTTNPNITVHTVWILLRNYL